MSPVRATWVPPQSSMEKAGFGRVRQILLAGVRMTHRDDANFVAIFFAEQRTSAGSNGFVDAHQAGHDRCVVEHGAIGDVLDTRSSSEPIGF